MKATRILKISRPITMWPLLAGFYLVGMGGIDDFLLLFPVSLIELLFFTLPINFYINGINDIYDRDSDKSNPNKDSWIEGVALANHEVGFVFKLAISFVLSFLLFIVLTSLSNVEHVILSFLFVIVLFLYSHDSFRLKEKPVLDFIVGGPILFLFPALIAFSLQGSIAEIPWRVFFLALPFMTFHLVAALRDEQHDRAAGMKTTAVLLGKTKTIFLSLIFILIAFVFTFPLKNFLLSFLLIVQVLYLSTLGNRWPKGFLYLFVLSCVVIILFYFWIYYVANWLGTY